MKVFYVCRTGFHTSLLAAHIHLGHISPNHSEAKKIYSLTGYDRHNYDDIGKPFLAGIDDQDDEIYTIGVTWENHLMIRAASEIIAIMNVGPDDWKIIDTSSKSSNWTAIGQLLRRLQLKTLSKAFFYLGARKELPRLKNAVYRENH